MSNNHAIPFNYNIMMCFKNSTFDKVLFDVMFIFNFNGLV